MKITFFLLLLTMLFCYSAAAQSIAEPQPPSLSASKPLQTPQSTIDVPPPASINSSSSLKPGAGNAFAKVLPVTVAFPGEIVPDTLDSGLLYRMMITSEGASSLGICISEACLSNDASIYIYSPDYQYILGPYTNSSLIKLNPFRTQQIPGSEIVVEIYSPNPLQSNQFAISKIYYDFTGSHSGNSSLKKDLLSDYNVCSINELASSSYGEPYQALKHSIIRYSYEYDGYLGYCTGVLVNSMLCDTAAYLLTAAHCICNQEEASTLIANFNYEANGDGRFAEIFSQQTLNGAALVATAPRLPDYDKYGRPSRELYPQLDFALLRLPEIPKAYKPYFAGIKIEKSDQSDHPFTIHHPMGGPKSISIASSAPYIDTYPEEDPDCRYLPLSHYHILSWEVGTTQAGSSGAPLFNDNNLVIGTLSGGYASCSSAQDDYFQRISKAWDYFPNPENQLRYWLAPNCDVTEIQPFDPYNIENPLPKSHLTVECTKDSSTANLSWITDSAVISDLKFDGIENQEQLISLFESNSGGGFHSSNRWEISDISPHSGSACISSRRSGSGNSGASFVLPSVDLFPGLCLSFWARSDGGTSSITVSASTRLSNFQAVASYEIGEEWAQYTISANENAQGNCYFRLSNTTSSENSDAVLYIDDILVVDSSINRSAVCTGYQLYCNNSLVAEFSDPSTTEYQCDISSGNSYTYYILNLYGDNGKSGKSNTVTISPGYVRGPSTAADDIQMDSNLHNAEIYPNPCYSEVSILLDTDITEAVADIININGSIAKSEKISSLSSGQEYNLNLSGIPSGNYLLLIHSGNNIYCHQKLIVVK